MNTLLKIFILLFISISNVYAQNTSSSLSNGPQSPDFTEDLQEGLLKKDIPNTQLNQEIIQSISNLPIEKRVKTLNQLRRKKVDENFVEAQFEAKKLLDITGDKSLKDFIQSKKSDFPDKKDLKLKDIFSTNFSPKEQRQDIPEIVNVFPLLEAEERNLIPIVDKALRKKELLLTPFP